MLKWFRDHWKVNNKDLFLILCTFAITGTLTAYISKQITYWLDVDRYSAGWWALKLGVLIIGYQFIILIVGFCFGKFQFFWNYEKKILRRMRLLKAEPATEKNETIQTASMGNRKAVTIAIFASGKGSNAQNIINHFRNSHIAKVGVIITDKPEAGVLSIASKENIPNIILEKNKFFNGDAYLAELKNLDVQFIVLAGFMRKVPTKLVEAFPGAIVNIHPALLPKYGGKGMYGENVHRSVLTAGEKESGITIHHVDEHYDNGQIIFQSKCAVDPNDTSETLANKIHQLEHESYPKVIEEMIKKMEG